MTGLPTCLAGEKGVLKCLLRTTHNQVHHRVDILTLRMQCVSVAHSTSVETSLVYEFMSLLTQGRTLTPI